MEALISIIIPVYNVEKYVKRCLDSIIYQTYKNLEIIVVDDGSTDTSYEICCEFKKKDSRIKLLHQNNAGVAAARNLGLKEVTGDWVSFVDSDDWIEPDFYSVFCDTMQNTEADIYMMGFTICYNNGEKRRGKEVEDTQYSSEDALTLLCENKRITSHLWNKLFRKKLFLGLEFQEGRMYEDIRISHLLFSKASQVVSISQYKYNYFIRSDSIVHKKVNVLDWYSAESERYIWLNREIEMGKEELVRAGNACFVNMANVAFYNLYTIPQKDIRSFTKEQAETYQTIKEFWKKNRKQIASVSTKLWISVYFPHVVQVMFLLKKKIG